MEDSSEKGEKKKKKQAESDFGRRCCLPILCNSIVAAFVFVAKLLGFKKQRAHSSSAAYEPLSSSPDVSYTAACHPLPTAAYGQSPPTDEFDLESNFGRRVPPPRRSTGGGGQID